MKNRKTASVLSAFLAIALTAAALVSCKSDKPDTPVPGSGSGSVSSDKIPETSGGAETEIDYTKFLPDAEYDYEDVVILHLNGAEEELFCMQEPTDQLSKAIYERNNFVEDKYKVTLKSVKIGDDKSEFGRRLDEDIKGGNGAYDIAAPWHWFGIEANGYYLNLRDFSDIHLENPYWVAGWTENSEINGVLNTAMCYFQYKNIGAARMLYMNDQLCGDLGLTSPVQMVYDGSWTLDAMQSMAKAATTDLNSDGNFDFEDQYGFGYNVWAGRAFLLGAGFSLVDMNNGTPEFHLVSEKNVTIFNTVYEFLNDTGYCYYGGDEGRPYSDIGDVTLFRQGRSLFEGGSLNDCSMITDSLENFTILPMPKLNETQADYIVGHTGPTYVALCKGSKAPERAAAILEALSILSYKDVMPVYYETNLKIRYQNDNGTNAKMIDFIIDRVAMNFAEINSTHLDGIGYAPFDLIAHKNKSYAAFMAQKEESLSVKLQTFIEGYTNQNTGDQ